MKNLTVTVALLALAACDLRASETPRPERTATETRVVAALDDSSVDPSDPWAGKWVGIEGTYAEITPTENGDYTIYIKGHDGPSAYQGRADGDVIRFARAGVEESIRTGGGDTGTEFPAGKTECIVISPDEGYCRG